jgi:hypothetical protein
MYRRILAVAAVVAASAAVASPAALAAPGQFTRFDAPTAFNGAHLYSRLHLDGLHKKVFVDCLRRNPGVNGFSARWTCTIDAYEGRDTLTGHATVDVLRRDGAYVFRTSEVPAPR